MSKPHVHFNVCLGNPPYQEDAIGMSASDKPVYHLFMDAAENVADKVEFISPARFLFNAGATPQEWNKKKLNDTHFKVLEYEQIADRIFPKTSITGGVAITYRDSKKEFGPIEVFTVYPELNAIKDKVWRRTHESLSNMFTNRGLYRYSDLAYEEIPDLKKKTADRRIAPSCFERMPEYFTEEKPDDGKEYIEIFGNLGGKRGYRWFRKDYVSSVENLDKYKVLVPKANGASGMLGEEAARIISKPELGIPSVGFTETFISVGSTDSKEEAEAILKYVKTKFARALLGILKVTQNNPKNTWEYVPVQDFTRNSDINWQKSISQIDQQLYKKYCLSQDEITFIEDHVKEMN